MVAGKSCAGSRKRDRVGGAEGREDWEGVVIRGNGVGGGSKNIEHLVCLCVSKEIVALTGGFFLPGMKQK